MTDKLSDWGYNFQIKLVASLFTDRLFLQQISDILDRKFFESEANQFIIGVIMDYFQEYKDAPTMEVFKVKLDELLTFIANIADARKMGTMKAKNGLPFGEFILLSRLFLYMENTFNSYSINSYDDFYMGFKAAFDFWNNKEDKLTKKAINFDWDKRGLTIGEAFTKYNSGYDSFKKQDWTINWLLEKFDITRIENPYITLKDPTRSLPEKQREAKLSAQNFICAVDGKKLSMKDAVAAHVISHANGGRTTWDNIVMVRKSHNVAMGTMDLNSYKELLKSMGKI